jgi:hypothetical protein
MSLTMLPSCHSSRDRGSVGAQALAFSSLNGEGEGRALAFFDQRMARNNAEANDMMLGRCGAVSRSWLDELDAGDAAMAPHQARAADGPETVERKIKRDAQLRCERADIEARAAVAQVEDIAWQEPRVVCRQDTRRYIDLRPLD